MLECDWGDVCVMGWVCGLLCDGVVERRVQVRLCGDRSVNLSVCVWYFTGASGLVTGTRV